MPMKFRCPNCKYSLKVSTKHAGKTAKCPSCEQKVKIPQLPKQPSAKKTPPKPKPAPAAEDDFLADINPDEFEDLPLSATSASKSKQEPQDEFATEDGPQDEWGDTYSLTESTTSEPPPLPPLRKKKKKKKKKMHQSPPLAGLRYRRKRYRPPVCGKILFCYCLVWL